MEKAITGSSIFPLKKAHRVGASVCTEWGVESHNVASVATWSHKGTWRPTRIWVSLWLYHILTHTKGHTSLWYLRSESNNIATPVQRIKKMNSNQNKEEMTWGNWKYEKRGWVKEWPRGQKGKKTQNESKLRGPFGVFVQRSFRKKEKQAVHKSLDFDIDVGLKKHGPNLWGSIKSKPLGGD